MSMSRYAAKRLIVAPRVIYRRRRSRELDPYARQLLETQSYGRHMYAFMNAVAGNPDLLTDVSIGTDGLAIDLGAYVGDWASRMVERFGCTVYAFEPSPGIAAKTSERFVTTPNVTVFPFGVGAMEETAQLSRDGPGSSLYGGRAAFGTVNVQVRDIVTVLRELDVQYIDVLKVNIEGAEYDVFDRLITANWLPRIGTISVQFHEWHPDAYRRRRQIRAAMSASHARVWSYGWVWELWSSPDRYAERRAAT
jgi:FkbM family methyltransferase